MSKYFISTLGCKVNQFESDAIAEALNEKNWEAATTASDADICIVNTCTVTGKASMQSRHIIRQLIRSNPDAKIVVTGCYAQTEAEEIRKIEGVDNIISHTEKHRIPETISAICENSAPATSPDCNTSCRETVFKQIDVNAPGKRTRPFLKIQDGCNAFCTYCIVPHTRGRSRSMPFDEVLERLKDLNRQGYQEVVLTGIHIGYYGQDLTPQRSFHDLLRAIDDAAPVPRIRLSSIEPREITDEIISLIADSKVFCNHFHIPLQSGDDEILKRMHRPYDSALFEELVLKIKRQIPDACIGADTIIGFPGETDDQFENTFRLIERLPLTYLHVFPYSPGRRHRPPPIPTRWHRRSRKTDAIASGSWDSPKKAVSSKRTQAPKPMCFSNIKKTGKQVF